VRSAVKECAVKILCDIAGVAREYRSASNMSLTPANIETLSATVRRHRAATRRPETRYHYYLHSQYAVTDRRP